MNLDELSPNKKITFKPKKTSNPQSKQFKSTFYRSDLIDLTFSKRIFNKISKLKTFN